MPEELIHKELSYKIVGVMFEVDNEIGYGHLERTYHRAIAKGFENIGLPYKSEVYTPIFFQGERVGSYYFDFLVDDKVIVELKVGEGFSRNYIQQLDRYLKSSGYQLGLLVQFTRDGVKYKRIVNAYPCDSYLRKHS